MQWNIILALIFAIIIALFAIVNMDPVAINYLLDKTEVPLILIILGFTLAGAIIIVIFNVAKQYANYKEIKKLKEDLAEAKKDLESYKNYKETVEKPANFLEEEQVFFDQLAASQESISNDSNLSANILTDDSEVVISKEMATETDEDLK